MRLSVEWKGSRYEAQLGAAIDLSLPVDFAGEQPTFSAYRRRASGDRSRRFRR